ncbi:MAG: hypothetical protein ACI9VR_003596 [Cognaticolwellia sp.]|jgi:hypothetical protein
MTLMSVLLTLACTPTGSVTLGDGADVDDTGVDDTGVDDTGEVEPDPNAAAGDYEGELSWSLPDWDWTICEMEISLEVDDEGGFALEDICIYSGRDGDEYDLDFNIEGQVDEDGEITGEITFVSWAIEGWSSYYLENYTSELEGSVDDDEINLVFFDEAEMGNNGPVAMPGFIEIER